mmetsp:Transcript_9174/g.22535  ORF Transcript_9174/g.22535 Transcript_9174/m.22535 type:complete len:100 (-) Transcript_9174:3-302(-)
MAGRYAISKCVSTILSHYGWRGGSSTYCLLRGRWTVRARGRKGAPPSPIAKPSGHAHPSRLSLAVFGEAEEETGEDEDGCDALGEAVAAAASMRWRLHD